MIAYHKLPRKDLVSVIKLGLRQKRSDTEDSKSIDRTNDFLNTYRLPKHEKIGLNRKYNIYCYVALGDEIIDIATGEAKMPDTIIKNDADVLLQVRVDAARCYISDLDLYDAVKMSVENNDMTTAARLAHDYWNAVKRLDIYQKNLSKIK